MTDAELLALIEFVRNHAASLCENISTTHFADQLAWETDDVDPLEIAEARGADDGATECRRDVQNIDCHEVLLQWRARK